jgi:hypothetical protein
VMADLGRYNAVPGSASSVAVAADVLADAGGFDISLVLAEDWDMWLRLARQGIPACVPRPLVAIRQHRGSASRDVGLMLREIAVVAQRHRVPVDVAMHLRWAAWMRLENGRRDAAASYYLRAAARGDLRSVGRAAVALAGRRVVERRRQRLDRSWASQGQVWLNTLEAPS